MRDPLFSHNNNLFTGFVSLDQPSTDRKSGNSESEDEAPNISKKKQSKFEQNYILRDPWILEYSSDYDNTNIDIEYGDIELGYSDSVHDLQNEDDNSLKSGSSVHLSYALPHSLKTGSSFDRKHVYKSPAFQPPNHGINGLDLIFRGGQPTTFQNYIQRRIHMDRTVDLVLDDEPNKFTENIQEDPDQGTWAGSRDWVQHWIEK